MHCPNCGKSADADQQFCRACGMGLENVGRLVAEHTSLPVEQRKIAKAELEQQLVRTMFNWITWGMIILGIGVVLLVVDKSFHIGPMLKFASTLLMLGGLGVATGGVLHAIKQGVSMSGKKRVDQISGSVDTKRLPTNPFPASLPSVTDRTTHLLPIDEPRANKVIDSNGRE